MQAETPSERLRWTLHDEPELVLGGGADAPRSEQFLYITAVMRMADGRVLVGDFTSSEIRFFGPEGKQQHSIGGDGRGPGEIPGLWTVRLVGDRIIAQDRFARIHLFDHDGEYLRSLPRPVSDRGTRIVWRGFLSDLSGVGTHTIRSDRDERRGSYEIRMEVVRLVADSAHPLGQIVFEHREGLTFGPQPAVDVFPDRICAGPTRAYQLACWTPEGRLMYPIDLSTFRGKVGVEVSDRERFFDAARKVVAAERFDQYREGIEFADVFPDFGRLVAAETGELWVGPLDPELAAGSEYGSVPEEPTRWSVVSPEGAWVTDVILPPRFRLWSAGRDWVAWVRMDDLDLEYAVVWRFDRGR